MSATAKKFGCADLGTVLKALIREPMTCRDLALTTNLGICSARELCRSLHKAKLLYIHHWACHSNNYVPAYHFGEGQDQRFEDRVPLSQARILDCFKSHSVHLGLAYLSKQLHMSERAIAKHLNILERKNILIGTQPPKKNKTWRLHPSYTPSKLHKTKSLPTQTPTTTPKPRPKTITTQQTWFSMLGIKDHAP